jgi:nicotinate (nicotinamide) nucleotide adenylyltransferase
MTNIKPQSETTAQTTQTAVQTAVETAVLIFGSFNPITKAHIDIGLQAQKQFPHSDIIYIPAKDTFLKNWKHLDSENTLDTSTRLSLIIQSVQPYNFKVSTIELEGLVDGRTYNTVEYFKQTYANVIICMGADKLCELDKWYNNEKLVSENKFMITTRNNTKGTLPNSLIKYSDNFTYKEGLFQDVSSTYVREQYTLGKANTLKDMLPLPVYEYLTTH